MSKGFAFGYGLLVPVGSKEQYARERKEGMAKEDKKGGRPEAQLVKP